MEKQLQAAEGYLELGMLVEANDEIENLPPELKTSSAVLVLRLEIYRAAEKWSLMEVVAQELWKRHQDDPAYWSDLAFAANRSSGLKEAHSILSEALEKFPSDALTLFNLGCYACQLGNLAEAKTLVGQAIKIDPKFKIDAIDDPDLEPLWEEIQEGKEF